MTNDSLLEKYVAGELTDEEQRLFQERQSSDAAFASEVASLSALQHALDDSSSLSDEEEHTLGRTHAAILALMSAGAVGTATTVATVGEKAVTSGGGFIQTLGLSVTQFSVAVVGVATAVGVFTISLLTPEDKPSDTVSPTQTTQPSTIAPPVSFKPEKQNSVVTEQQATQQPEPTKQQTKQLSVATDSNSAASETPKMNTPTKAKPEELLADNNSLNSKSTVNSQSSNNTRELETSLTRFEQRFQIYKERHDLQGQATILREIIRLHLALGDNSNAWKQSETLLPLLPTVPDDKSRAQGWLAIAQAALATNKSAATVRDYCLSAELCFLDSSTIPTDIRNALENIRKKLR